MPHTTRETEIKLAVDSVAAARAILRRAGFCIHKPRVFERNAVFDTPALALRKSGSLVRLRQAGGTATLTYKGPASPGRHKSREELELEIPKPATVAAILDRLDYRPVFHYEKWRTEYRHSSGGGTVTVDETPVGVYLELEGSPSWIDRTARRLGFTEGDYITASYGKLYLDWCASRKKKPADMVFTSAQLPGRRPTSAP